MEKSSLSGENIPRKNGPDHFVVTMIKENMETLRLHHSVIPRLNIGKEPVARCRRLYEYPHISVSPPKAIYMAPNHFSEDLCFKRTKMNELYEKRLFISRKKCQTAEKSKIKLDKIRRKDLYYASHFRLSKQLDCKPDPYFYGNYDYYYTGGSLCPLLMGENEGHVAFVEGPNAEKLDICKYSDRSSTQRLEVLCSHNFSTSGEIFEVQPIRQSNEWQENRFALRQRNDIFLCNFTEDSINVIANFKTDGAPFISFAQGRSPHNILINTMRQCVRQYDLGSNTSKSSPHLRKIFDLRKPGQRRICWNTIKALEDGNFLYASEDSLRIIDLRCPLREWLNVICSSSELPCEFISGMAKSSFSNLFYLGTSHKVYNLDLRYLENSFSTSESVVCQWTHQMDYPPLHIDILQHENSEIIAASSLISTDLRLFNFNLKCEGSRGDHFESLALPYQPTTLMEAYESSRLRGTCLSTQADLKRRLKHCITGLRFYPNPNHLRNELLLSTSGGDVFSYTVIINDPTSQVTIERTNKGSDEMMAQYADEIFQGEQPKLHQTDVINLGPLRKVFQLVKLDKHSDEGSVEAMCDQDVTTSQRRTPHYGRWQKDLKTLHGFKDALAQDILSIWDTDFKDEKDTLLSESVNIKAEFVSSWLAYNFVETRIEESHDNIESQQISNRFTEELFTDVIQDQMQSSQHQMEPIKKAKGKSKYRKGF